jgi:ornithine carbamoyltransferase
MVSEGQALHGRSFVKELDLTRDEFGYLFRLAAELKAAKRDGTERQRLTGRNIALVFEKTSTRTRCAFEVAAHDQGAHTTYLDPAGAQLGHKESVRDTGRVLGRMFDGIQYRGRRQADVEALAAYAGVPVWNGLTDEWHPTQSLCDAFTMAEHGRRPLGEIAFAYLGDARNNMGNSLLVTGALLGMDVRIVAPPDLLPDERVRAVAAELADRSGARLTITDDIAKGVRDVDFVHTDVWVSMGEPAQTWGARITALRPYQVNKAVLDATGNPHVKFMHCLPAFHDRQTLIGEQIFQEFGMEGLEVTGEVFESGASIVFEQAENRLHTIKAILVATLGG